jgi:hypothetical protein
VQSTASTLQHQAEDALSTAKDKATATLGDKLGEKKPAWLTPSTAPATNGAGAGAANGHQA